MSAGTCQLEGLAVAETTGISWTDSTWSPVTGCKAVSPGCANCFAATLAATRLKKHPAYAGLAHLNDSGRAVWSGEVRLHPDRLTQPLRWLKPRRIFVCDMSDLFHADVPDEFLDRVFATMALCRQHTFQVLTKRPARMRDYLEMVSDERDMQRWLNAASSLTGEMVGLESFDPALDWPLPNVWLGVSVESRAYLPRLDILRQIPAAVRFASLEPLLEHLGDINLDGIGWAIIGGESSQAGAPARPCDLAWIRNIVAQCKAAGVPAFVKQLGSSAYELDDTTLMQQWLNGGPLLKDERWSLHKTQLRHRAGADIEEFPEDLRVREFPC